MKFRRMVLFLLVLAVAGCATPPGRRGSVTTDLDASAQREAAALYRQLLEMQGNADPREVQRAGVELLESYPGARDEPHVLLITAEAARASGDRVLAERLLERLGRLHPESPYGVEGAWLQASAAREQGRWAQEADALVRFYGAAVETDPRHEAARDRLRELLDQFLDTEEIDTLARTHPRSAIGSTAHWLVARRLYDENADPREVVARLESFLQEYPRSRYAEDARALLGTIRQDFGILPGEPGLDVAAPDRIGLLVPLSGEYAALGQAMFDGAMLAIEEHNRATGENLRLVALDSRGDEVVAVLAARKLIDEENVIAIVGCLLSPTTVAVATLCEERGVPLVSPTATKETIGDLGAFVFQTNLTKDFETRMVARAAVLALRRERFGILYPQGEEGQALADRFRDEVQRWGGRVVVERAYDRSATDFGTLLREMRAVAPEALFVPAGPNEMRLIAPQLVFQDLRSQLLGPSSWNNSLLVREVGSSLDRAVFPSDVALIPEIERERFESLWQRRYPSSPSNAFGLKTYFAARHVIEVLDRETGNTRLRARDRLEAAFFAGGGETATRGLQPLRMIDGSSILAFPAEVFPIALVAAAPVDTLDVQRVPDIEDLPR